MRFYLGVWMNLNPTTVKSLLPDKHTWNYIKVAPVYLCRLH